jgi:hypothetical protein
MNAAHRGIALAVLLLLAAPAAVGFYVARGSDAVRLLGLDAAAGSGQQAPLPGQSALKQRLLKEPDLGVGVRSRRLVYTCGGLARNATAAGYQQHVVHARARRRALQLLQANLADPDASALPKSASGVPKLHRRVGGCPAALRLSTRSPAAWAYTFPQNSIHAAKSSSLRTAPPPASQPLSPQPPRPLPLSALQPPQGHPQGLPGL